MKNFDLSTPGGCPRIVIFSQIELNEEMGEKGNLGQPPGMYRAAMRPYVYRLRSYEYIRNFLNLVDDRLLIGILLLFCEAGYLVSF